MICAQEADPVRGIPGAHRGRETAELVGSAGCVGRGCVCVEGLKRGMGCLLNDSELSVSTPTGGRQQPRTRGNGARRRNKGAERFTAKYIAAEKLKAELRHTVVCMPEHEAKDQSKRARADSLAVVDEPRVARTCILRRFFGLPISY